ncbi:DUF7553 family protein [Haloterrigena salifodinae]|uniref:DUF7553 family protein n=1 Tax=Haloterrigena salifodinae TaxID=2675099 RepID=UPI002D21AA00|nr:hypothetical protein [Haloterrigena salifodinae]
MEENHLNKHFHDSRYYLARSAEHAKLGLGETLTPYATRLRAAVGRDEDPETEPTASRRSARNYWTSSDGPRDRPATRSAALEGRSRGPERTSPPTDGERKS